MEGEEVVIGSNLWNSNGKVLKLDDTALKASHMCVRLHTLVGGDNVLVLKSFPVGKLQGSVVFLFVCNWSCATNWHREEVVWIKPRNLNGKVLKLLDDTALKASHMHMKLHTLVGGDALALKVFPVCKLRGSDVDCLFVHNWSCMTNWCT